MQFDHRVAEYARGIVELTAIFGLALAPFVPVAATGRTALDIPLCTGTADSGARSVRIPLPGNNRSGDHIQACHALCERRRTIGSACDHDTGNA